MADKEVVLLSNFLFRYAFFLCVKGYDLHPSRDVHNTTATLKTDIAMVVEMIPNDNF
jgi:hypothetical protein